MGFVVSAGVEQLKMICYCNYNLLHSSWFSSVGTLKMSCLSFVFCCRKWNCSFLFLSSLFILCCDTRHQIVSHWRFLFLKSYYYLNFSSWGLLLIFEIFISMTFVFKRDDVHGMEKVCSWDFKAEVEMVSHWRFFVFEKQLLLKFFVVRSTAESFMGCLL